MSEQRKALVRGLMSHPQYLNLTTAARLRLIRKLEQGLGISAAMLHLQALQWLKTGKLEEEHGPSRPVA